MTSILLPTDFSDNSINAIHYAVELFQDARCEFYFLNVQRASSFVSDDLMTMQPSTTIYQNLIDTAKKSIEQIITDIKNQYHIDQHVYHSIVDYDNFIDAICQTVDSKGIDLIVMGTHGATGAAQVLFGSNTVRVMQRGNCPVLAIPQHCKYKPIQRIAFTSNYYTAYKAEELQPLLNLAQKNKARIDVIHLIQDEPMSDEQVNNMAFLDGFFINLNHKFVNIDSQDLFETVEEYIQHHDIDLLAMMSRKHSFLERLFTRHTVETFAFKVSVPFLVMENTGAFMG